MITSQLRTRTFCRIKTSGGHGLLAEWSVLAISTCCDPGQQCIHASHSLSGYGRGCCPLRNSRVSGCSVLLGHRRVVVLCRSFEHKFDHSRIRSLHTTLMFPALCTYLVAEYFITARAPSRELVLTVNALEIRMLICQDHLHFLMDH